MISTFDSVSVTPNRDELVTIVSSGRVPDETCVRYGDMIIEASKAPDAFRRVAFQLREEGKDTVAAAYDGLANTVQSVLSHQPVKTQSLPQNGFVEEILNAWPTNWNSIVTTCLHQRYIAAAAQLLYNQCQH